MLFRSNIARTAFGTLAYVLGGASYVYLAGYDEAVSTPNEDSARVALRTLQILAHEHGFGDTIDPLGGSYYVETLTAQVEKQILEGMARIERAGGALAVIETGLGRQIMTQGAVRRQRAIEQQRIRLARDFRQVLDVPPLPPRGPLRSWRSGREGWSVRRSR